MPMYVITVLKRFSKLDAIQKTYLPNVIDLRGCIDEIDACSKMFLDRVKRGTMFSN